RIMSEPDADLRERHWQHFVDGAFLAGSSGERLFERDPRTGERSFSIARGNTRDVDLAAQAARASQAAWRALRPVERGRILGRIAGVIREEADLFVMVEQRETGKPRGQAAGDVELAARYFEYYAGLVELACGEVVGLGEDYHSFTLHEPYGVVGIILPWNAPINQAGRGIAPALAAGNAVVVKPSEFTSVSLLLLAELATRRAGLPAGVLNVVTGTGPEVGAAIVSHRHVRKVAFTGSLRAAQEIGHIAADRILPLSLELGGKSPNLVFADADRERALDGVVRGITLYAGQACSAGSRCLVERSILEPFVEGLRHRMAALRVGPGDDDQIGPIITQAQHAKVTAIYHAAAGDSSGQFHAAPLPDHLQNCFVPPAIFVTETTDSTIASEEVFGPLLVVTPFDSEAEALRLANASEYGLAACIWTNNLKRAHRLAGAIEAGQVYVNEYFAGGVETPFGGFKKSGYGREKGIEALREYTQVKCVTMRL
ncbi:MAG: aldehyde dehydrogenase, partial [Novosphingobium sp.]